jgi:hypothetical protein
MNASGPGINRKNWALNGVVDSKEEAAKTVDHCYELCRTEKRRRSNPEGLKLGARPRAGLLAFRRQPLTSRYLDASNFRICPADRTLGDPRQLFASRKPQRPVR